MGLFHQWIWGLDETQALIQKEMTTRHSMTVEESKYLANLKIIREQLKAQNDLLCLYAVIDMIKLESVLSMQHELLMQAKTLMDAGIKSGNSEMTKQAAVMMMFATNVAQQSLGTVPPGSPFSLPFDSL